LILLLVARPLSVMASTAWFGISLREQAFLSWAGLRGAVPIVLATVPIVYGVDPNRTLFNVVFMLVVAYTMLQGPSLPYVAKRLGVAAPVHAHRFDLDAAPLDRLDAEVLQMRVPPDSRLHGVEVFELRLPPGANVALIVREGRTIVPSPETMLRHGDDLLVVTPASRRVATEQRLRAVNEHGRLAGWVETRRRNG
jgi:potassium/hydrogen antiporter